MANLSKVLKQLNKQWKEAEAAEIGGGFTPLPDGSYVAILSECPRVELSKASERIQVAWPLKIDDGKLKGKTTMRFDGLDTDLGMSYAKGTMDVLGIEYGDDLEELPEILEKWFDKKYKGRQINIGAKTADEFTNIYINGFADEEEGKDNKDDKDDKKDDKKKKGKGDDDDKKDKGKDKPTKKELKAMKRSELKDVIKEHSLKLDPDDYDEKEDLVSAIIDALEE